MIDACRLSVRALTLVPHRFVRDWVIELRSKAPLCKLPFLVLSLSGCYYTVGLFKW